MTGHYSSHSIFTRPFAGILVVFVLVGLEKVSNLRDEWIVGVRVSHQRADGQKHLWNGKCRGPLVLQNVEADAAIGVDVTVVNSRRKRHFWRFEWVVSREVDVEEEHTSRVWGIIWAHDGCLPCELIFFVDRASRAVGGRVLSEIDELFLDSFKGHCKIKL